jgi:hypothetical protein
MRTDNRFRRHAPSTLATLCLCAAINTATAAKRTQSFTPACANRDPQLVMLIEEHGRANIVRSSPSCRRVSPVTNVASAKPSRCTTAIAIGPVLSRGTQVNSSMAEQRIVEGRLS